jgi:hypothetical protein
MSPMRVTGQGMIIELHDLDSLVERRVDQPVLPIALDLIVSSLKRKRHNLEDTIAAIAITNTNPDRLWNRLSAVEGENER